MDTTDAFKLLNEHYQKAGKGLNMASLFAADPNRFSQFSKTFNKGEILLDYSKNIVTQETLSLLFKLARESNIEKWRDDMFNGVPINTTENRSVLHIVLRNRSNKPVHADGKDVMPEVNRVLDQMTATANDIRSGKWLGYTGKRITDVVNIGIGGMLMFRSYLICLTLFIYI